MYTAKRAPEIFAARSKSRMPSSGPSSQCAFGVNAKRAAARPRGAPRRWPPRPSPPARWRRAGSGCQQQLLRMRLSTSRAAPRGRRSVGDALHLGLERGRILACARPSRAISSPALRCSWRSCSTSCSARGARRRAPSGSGSSEQVEAARQQPHRAHAARSRRPSCRSSMPFSMMSRCLGRDASDRTHDEDSQGRLSRCRPRHALPARHQGAAQGDAAARRQADHPVRVEEAVAAGITNIIIVTGRGKNAIEDHFDVSYELEKHAGGARQDRPARQVRAVSNMINVSYVRQGEALGLGHAVLMARDLVGDEPFAVMLGDDIIDSAVPCMRQMIDVFERHQGPVIAVHQVPRDEISAYGVIDGGPRTDERPRRTASRDLVEKPRGRERRRPRHHRPLHPDARHLRRAREDAARRGGRDPAHERPAHAARDSAPIYGYRFEGMRHDAGNKLGFLKATVEFALKREDLGGPFREYLKGAEAVAVAATSGRWRRRLSWSCRRRRLRCRTAALAAESLDSDLASPRLRRLRTCLRPTCLVRLGPAGLGLAVARLVLAARSR